MTRNWRPSENEFIDVWDWLEWATEVRGLGASQQGAQQHRSAKRGTSTAKRGTHTP